MNREDLAKALETFWREHPESTPMDCAIQQVNAALSEAEAIARGSKRLALMRHAGEHARVAATIEDGIHDLKIKD